jgi:hypothetical protein
MGKKVGVRGKAGDGKKLEAGVLYLGAPTRVRQKGKGREREREREEK